MKANPKYAVEFSIQLLLTESEARALEVLPSYGTDDFLKFFYKNLGRSYLEPHEKGLRSLFASIKEQVNGSLWQIDEVRKAMNATYYPIPDEVANPAILEPEPEVKL